MVNIHRFRNRHPSARPLQRPQPTHGRISSAPASHASSGNRDHKPLHVKSQLSSIKPAFLKPSDPVIQARRDGNKAVREQKIMEAKNRGNSMAARRFVERPRFS